MVSYLLLVGLGLTLIVSGITYNIVSDIVDLALNAFISVYANIPDASMDSASIEGGNMILMVFKFCLMPILVILCYFLLTMAQKPIRQW